MNTEFLHLLKPQNVFLNKVRLGPAEDGGYVMTEYVLENCSALVTYGVGMDIRYEAEFSDKYKKPIYLFDHTTPLFENPINKEFAESKNMKIFAEGLGFGNKCKDFNVHYEELGLTPYVFLKIDIESHEYEYFAKANIDKLNERVMGILIEFHYINDESNRTSLVKILREFKNYFILSHIHANNWGTTWEFDRQIIPTTYEVSFINRKFVDKYEPDNQEYPILGLDIPNNPHIGDYSLEFLKRY